jgi:hypothetical protein
VLIGAPGIGKDMSLVPVRYAVGTWNFRDITLNDLVSKNNDFLCAVIVRVNEARDVGDSNRGRIDRYGLHDHMKALMASPPETHRINRKYVPEYIALSRVGFIITSNHDDALYLPADDRRDAVAKSECARADFHKEYFDKLYHWYYYEGGINHVVAYLQNYDLANFNPKLAPPKTKAFWGMVSADRGADGELTDAIEALGEQLGKKKGKAPDAHGDYGFPAALTIPLLLTVAPSLEWLTDRKMSRATAHRLKRCGYVPELNRETLESGGLWRIRGKRTMIYARIELSPDQRHAAACASRDTLADAPKLVVDNKPKETEQ